MITRWLLAGPFALTLAIIMMAAVPIWFPVGSYGVNTAASCVVLFFALWCVTFFYPAIQMHIKRIVIVMSCRFAVHLC